MSDLWNSEPGGGGGISSVAWGDITGTLSAQTDLQSALDAKQDDITLGTTAQYFRGDLSLATFPTAVSAFANDAGYLTSISGLNHNSLGNLAVGDVHTQYALLAGRSGGQSINGGTAANDDLILQGTTNSTRTSSYVILQPNGGNVGMGTSTPASFFQGIVGNADFRFSRGASDVTPTMAAINTDASGKAVALVAGTSGSAFLFDSAGFFGIQSNSKANFLNNTAGAGTDLLRMESDGKTKFVGGIAAGVSISDTVPNNGLHLGNLSANYFVNLRMTTNRILSVRSSSFSGDEVQILSRNDADNLYQPLRIDGSVLYLNGQSSGNVGIGQLTFGSSATKTIAVGNGTAPGSSPADAFQMYSADITAGNAAPHFRTEAGDVIKLYKGSALTTQLTMITHTEPGTPDYAIQDMTNIAPYGFVTQDEANTLLKVVKNLQTRVAELESRLQAFTLLA